MYVHASHKRSLTHHPSSQGWASSVPSYICCLSVLWLGRLLHRSFLSTFLKLVCYAHIFPCTYACKSVSCMYSNPQVPVVEMRVHIHSNMYVHVALYIYVHYCGNASFLLTTVRIRDELALTPVKYTPCTSTCNSAGRVLCLECRVSWVRVPPEAAHFLRKSDCLGCAVLLCLVVYSILLASFFLLHLSLTCTYQYLSWSFFSDIYVRA